MTFNHRRENDKTIMTEYMKRLRKHVGHAPVLECGSSVILEDENRNGRILLQLRNDPDEVEMLRFFAFDELPENILPRVKTPLQEYVRMKQATLQSVDFPIL